jgi:chromosomal replication initiation ATPase DnaA
MIELWESALHDLKGRVSSENYENWLAPVRCAVMQDDTLLLRIPNRFYADWISSHYLDIILSALRDKLGKQCIRVQWEVDDGLARETLERARQQTSVTERRSGMQPRVPDSLVPAADPLAHGQGI